MYISIVWKNVLLLFGHFNYLEKRIITIIAGKQMKDFTFVVDVEVGGDLRFIGPARRHFL